MAAIRGNKIISVPLAEAVGELKRLDEEIIEWQKFSLVKKYRATDEHR